jgi:predicted ATPase
MTDFAILEAFVPRDVSEPFIRHIRFPRFKNLESGFRIDFQYPITALVGTNGTNKSSILRALQGCPELYNIGNFWFSTDLDPISDRDPHRYVHGYRLPSDSIAEVIKTRTGKAGRGPDYFETSAPRRRDGMQKLPEKAAPEDASYRSKTRWRPIEKEVVYLDFRQELPAYDILFHFNWRDQKNDTESKKSRIRRGAPHVAAALTQLESSRVHYGKNRILSPAEDLNPAEVADVSQILGRDYTSIRLVKHSFFGVEGYTARLVTKHHSYSEAYAGSGEFAAVMLVRTIGRANPKSLVLLDEPETSLHPAAQRELMSYIARACVNNKHQVVLATHAPSMIENLPDYAIKLLDIDSTDGRVRLTSQASSPQEAFRRLGATIASRTLIVEDELAAEFVKRVARIRGADYLNSIDVYAPPGGAQNLAKRYIPMLTNLNAATVMLLDGDQRPTETTRSGDSLADTALEEELRRIGIGKADVHRNGGRTDPEIEFALQARKTLNWASAHLGYLPGTGSPEELLLALAGLPPAANSDAAKEEWVSITKQELGYVGNERPTAADILATQRRRLSVLDSDTPELTEIASTLSTLLPHL